MVQRLECCIGDRLWMLKNLLKLNDIKTEFLVLGYYRQLLKFTLSNITVGVDTLLYNDDDDDTDNDADNMSSF